jgi:hypothetical protein
VRVRGVAIALLVASALPLSAGESAEAAKVAAWVRALPPPSVESSWFGVLGAINPSLIGGAADTIRSVGPRAFYNDAPRLQQAVGTLQGRATAYLPLLVAGGNSWYRDVQHVPWGLIEVAKGELRWELLDAAVAGAQNSGGRYVGTLMPYAGWELLAAGYPASNDAECLRLFNEDFFYLAFDRRMDRYKDLDAWKKFVALAVERYDGDGLSDMPGLTIPIKYWQVHNEPEGARCGLFRSDPAAFAELMRATYETIHAACSDCIVLNGGAGIQLADDKRTPIPAGVTFWSDFAAAGGAPYVDVIAVHYNQGKDPDHGNIENFEYQIKRIRDFLGNKPVWVTEFGTLIGDTGGRLMGLPEAEAGAWFVRFYAAGLAAGATRFFSDSVAFVTFPALTIQLPYYVNQLMTARLAGFTSAEKMATGQYRFRVGGSDVWVLWNGVPSSLTGSVVATDIYGNETTVDAKSLAPRETAPVIVRPVTARRRAAHH